MAKRKVIKKGGGKSAPFKLPKGVENYLYKKIESKRYIQEIKQNVKKLKRLSEKEIIDHIKFTYINGIKNRYKKNEKNWLWYDRVTGEQMRFKKPISYTKKERELLSKGKQIKKDLKKYRRNPSDSELIILEDIKKLHNKKNRLTKLGKNFFKSIREAQLMKISKDKKVNYLQAVKIYTKEAKGLTKNEIIRLYGYGF